jgi:excisionase family DNA binding protein
MPTKIDGVHPFRESESAEIQELYRVFLLEKAPALVGPNHESIPIPESIYNILLQVVGYMKEGKGVSVIPVMHELTTQQAANLLGVSRPFLVGVLRRGEIPFHKIGTHRRVYLKDLIAYRAKRDGERKRILNEIARRDIEDGAYDYIPTSGEE